MLASAAERQGLTGRLAKTSTDLMIARLAAVVWLSVTVVSDPTDTISYQIHSYNDLRSWPQLLQKMLVPMLM